MAPTTSFLSFLSSEASYSFNALTVSAHVAAIFFCFKYLRALYYHILGLEKIKDYLVGGKFDLYTDCRAIRWLRESKNDSSKLFRWSLRLSEFDANVIHIQGKRSEERRV